MVGNYTCLYIAEDIMRIHKNMSSSKSLYFIQKGMGEISTFCYACYDNIAALGAKTLILNAGIRCQGHLAKVVSGLNTKILPED